MYVRSHVQFCDRTSLLCGTTMRTNWENIIRGQWRIQIGTVSLTVYTVHRYISLHYNIIISIRRDKQSTSLGLLNRTSWGHTKCEGLNTSGWHLKVRFEAWMTLVGDTHIPFSQPSPNYQQCFLSIHTTVRAWNISQHLGIYESWKHDWLIEFAHI